MKKCFLYFSTISLLLLVGCIKVTPPPTETKALEFSYYIRPNEEGFSVVIDVDIEQLEVDNIIGYGFVYHNELTKSIDEMVIGGVGRSVEFLKTEETHYSFTFDGMDEEEYDTAYFFRSYIKYGSSDAPSILYTHVVEAISLYLLARQDLSTFSKEVVGLVEGNLVQEVRLEVDTKNYQVIALNGGYQAVITTDYNYITIRVTPIDEKFFATDVILIVNEVELEPNKWSISENILTYRFDDPNWTNPY